MYGTPYANFTIKGKVVNEESIPVPDIEIKCLVEHHGDNRSWFDTIPAVSTSAAGTFHCQFEEFTNHSNGYRRSPERFIRKGLCRPYSYRQ